MEKTINEYISAVRSILAWKDSPPLAHVRSYGCQLNFSDGEKLKGMLSKMGLILALSVKMPRTEFSEI